MMARAWSKFSASALTVMVPSPPAAAAAPPPPRPPPPPPPPKETVAPMSASASEICRAVRVGVPIVIMAAVASATPGMPSGSRRCDEGIEMLKEMEGVRLDSRITSLRPFESVRSTGRGSLTLRTSFDTGARL